MAAGKDVLYVGTYTHGTSVGVHIYDMDPEVGALTERKVIPINNASYLTVSRSGKYLYSIADEGVEAYRILPDGDLEYINQAGIRGMRGCYLSTDSKDRFLYVAGYHDGKVTVMSLNKDGSIGHICDGIFHKGIGSVADRNFRPHVNCVIPTPDEKYLCAVDLGLDHVKIYSVDPHTGKLRLVDILRCELECGPRHMLFSKDGRFAYLICEIKNYISVYAYDGSGKNPKFEWIENVRTISDQSAESNSAASGMKLSKDGQYLYCSNAGENSMGIFRVNQQDGTLEKVCILPVSGDYPKDIDVFSGNQFVLALNHESNSITTFHVNYEKGTIAMNRAPLYVETPNCALVLHLDETD
ncbi:MAG: lactonase family protein [Lachnospiraceae bacterium]